MTPEREQEILAMVALGVGEPWRSVVVELLDDRDKVRFEIDYLRRERDEARAQLADIRKLWDAVVDAAIDALPDGGGLVSGVAEAARQLGVARRERDEARAQLAALREAVRSMREKHDAELEDGGLVSGVAEAARQLVRLRRLPVIATCGECGHVGFGDYCSHPRFDGLEKHERPELNHDAAPPEWCPLREVSDE